MNYKLSRKLSMFLAFVMIFSSVVAGMPNLVFAEDLADPTEPVIELESIATAKVKAKGETVKVEGVVTGRIGNNVFLEDNTAAIYLYNGGNNIEELAVGNKVILTGKLDEYNGLKQIRDAKINELVSKDNQVEPLNITLEEATEENESKLVKVENLEITNVPENPEGSYSIKATDGQKSIYKI